MRTIYLGVLEVNTANTELSQSIPPPPTTRFDHFSKWHYGGRNSLNIFHHIFENPNSFLQSTSFKVIWSLTTSSLFLITLPLGDSPSITLAPFLSLNILSLVSRCSPFCQECSDRRSLWLLHPHLFRSQFKCHLFSETFSDSS